MSDIIKDTQKDDTNKVINSVGAVQQFKSVFLNEHHTFLVRKSERLASALYVITGFISDTEPIRTRLRGSALDLISRSSHPQTYGPQGGDVFASTCAEIGTLLETAQSAGLVSSMNAKLICDEYVHLAHFAKQNYQRIIDKGQDVLVSDMPDNLSNTSPINKKHKTLSIKDKSNTSIEGSPVKQKSARRTTILAIFNTRERVGIKDVAALIEGCSEKTIQRELLALVEEGLLIKEGERRWSTYKLATSN